MKEKTTVLFLLFLLIAFSMSISRADALWTAGKTWSGTLSNDPYMTVSKRGFPVTQNVTMRIEKIQGDSAEIFLSWSQNSKGTGKAGSATVNAQVYGTKISCSTGKETKMQWTFTIEDNGAVRCTLTMPELMVTRSGFLH
jgi:hypothetical protein